MSSYDEIEKEFKRKIKELQKRCKHIESDWRIEYWAPGHSTGYKIKMCLNCLIELKKELIT